MSVLQNAVTWWEKEYFLTYIQSNIKETLKITMKYVAKHLYAIPKALCIQLQLFKAQECVWVCYKTPTFNLVASYTCFHMAKCHGNTSKSVNMYLQVHVLIILSFVRHTVATFMHFSAEVCY